MVGSSRAAPRVVLPGMRAVLLALGGLLVACRPSVGGACEKGEARCLDASRALACEQGHFIETPCRGPKGCVASEQSIACDIDKNRSGDRCSLDEEGSAVCQDGQHLLACHGGTYQAVPCRGPRGCVLESGHALCDTSVGVAGEACRDEGKKCCAEDKSAVLSCKERRLSTLYTCRGPRGCIASGSKLDCDMSMALESDPCDPRLEGHIACNGERTATLVCKGSKFVLDEKCKPSMGCFAEDNQTQCRKLH
jgi:hypothetical protein